MKRLFNQAFFERILIIRDHDEPEGFAITAELNEPFGTLLSAELRAAEAEYRASTQEKNPAGQAASGVSAVTHSRLSQAQGLSKTLLVVLG